jgi:hypothetical protein
MHNQVEPDNFSTPHARSFSIESEASVYSDEASTSASATDFSRMAPPRLRLGTLPPFISTRHVASNSPDSYLPTPDASVASGDEMSSSATPSGTSSSTSTAATITPQGDGRQRDRNLSFTENRSHTNTSNSNNSNNNSYAYNNNNNNNAKRPRRALHDQMSMPDLRTVRVNFGRATLPSEKLPALTKAPSMMTMNNIYNNHNNNMRSGSVPNPLIHPSTYMPSPVSSRQGSASSDGPATATTAASALASSMDGEHNRYFRRHSSLPSAATTTIPKSLLCLMDAARSLLFAISQIYQSLQQLTYSTNDARMISILRKVLDPAYQDMVQLIHKLDRFDEAATKSTAKSSSIASALSSTTRAVIESSRDAVASFGRVVSVVALQLRALARAEDDVRFLRQTLLMLYGAAAELAHAWHGMAPHIEAVKAIMVQEQQQQRRRHRPHINKVKTSAGAAQSLSSSPTRVLQLAASTSSSSSSSAAAGGTSELGSPSGPLPRARTILPSGPNHAARRHAGSFSFKDVEIGKTLPSIEPVPPVPLPVSSTPTQTMRSTTATVRHVKSVPSTSSPASSSPANSPSAHFHQTLHSTRFAGAMSSLNSRQAHVGAGVHSRQGSLASLLTTGSSSSSPPPASLAHSRIVNLPAIETPPKASRQVIDKQALDAMKAALEAAPAVWEMIEELLSDDNSDGVEGGNGGGDRNGHMADLREDLDHAKKATDRLREDLFAVQRGDPDGDRRSLRDNAHVFVKVTFSSSRHLKQQFTFGLFSRPL